MSAQMLLQIADGPECCVAELAKMLELRLVHEHYVIVKCLLGAESQLTDDADLGPSIVQVELCVEQVSVTSNGFLEYLVLRVIDWQIWRRTVFAYRLREFSFFSQVTHWKPSFSSSSDRHMCLPNCTDDLNVLSHVVQVKFN